MKTAIATLVGLWLGFVIYKLYLIYHNDFASNVPWLMWVFSAIAALFVAVVFLMAV